MLLEAIRLPPARPAARRSGRAAGRPGGRARRLVHVFPSFDVGGAQVRFAALAESLGPGFEHTVISLSDSYQAAGLLRRDAPVRCLEPLTRGGALPTRLAHYRARLEALRPDLLLTHNWGAMEVAAANLLSRIPHIHLEDGFGPEEATRQYPRRVWSRRLVLAGSQVVVPSVTLREIATGAWRLDPRRIHHIPNGVSARSAFATRLGDVAPDLPAGPRIVWAGALRPEKNPLRLVRAFARLREPAVLLVLGDGPERAAVTEEVARLGLGGRVRLLGRRADTRDLIMQCDILALSSDTEQMPLVVLEAMDAGLPVASADVGDVRRMVAAENAPFVRPAAEETLAEALQTLAADPDLRRRVGDANRRRCREAYTLGGMTAAYAALFQRLTWEEEHG